ncbi:DUF2142 domain-containing protein [Bifidobacterium samirii]|uniref:DUF2142 domain-containing protein n=1 Tax=Bifidobacterium samirii TaxID=2306974 RepID=A0A430FU97_9BIFI|nr:DUF2142 domain-containing protein [Bifidobacterium samirii]RSX56570.1 hypothetical protein D2E24_1115 [Bifidobacterium samirii]
MSSQGASHRRATGRHLVDRVSDRASGGAAFDRYLSVFRRLMPLIVVLGTLIMGGGFMALTQPGHIPDVWAHVYRVDGMLHGDVLAHPVESRSRLHGGEGNVGGHVSWQWIDYSQEHYDGYDPTVILPDTITVSDSNGADVPYNNTATNSPLVYLPQLAGFALGDALGLSAGATYYLTETITLVAYALCMALAVFLLPRWRILAALVMLFPLTIHRYSYAISADSMTQALAFLLTCMLVRATVRRVTTGYCAALAVLCVALSMCKFVYAPMSALTLLVPWVQRGLADGGPSSGTLAGASPEVATSGAHAAIGKRSVTARAASFRAQLGILASGVALSAVWLMVWMRLTGWFVTTPMLVSHAEMTARKQALLSDPSSLLAALKAIVMAIVTARSNMGRRLDSLVIGACWLMIAALLVVLVVATIRRAMPARLLVFWWGSAVVMIGILLLTYLALWLQYTPAGAGVVDGVQHRYFLPLALIGVICAAECLRAVGTSRRRLD